MNSCNPVFMDVGARVGIEGLYEYFEKLGLFEKTGVDLPGEATSIMHKIENVGAVELATISFGQSFQITPLQLLRAVSAVINGGNLVTPHFGMYTTDSEGNTQNVFDYPVKSGAISEETSETMKELLGLVVSEGTGKTARWPVMKWAEKQRPPKNCRGVRGSILLLLSAFLRWKIRRSSVLF